MPSPKKRSISTSGFHNSESSPIRLRRQKSSGSIILRQSLSNYETGPPPANIGARLSLKDYSPVIIKRADQPPTSTIAENSIPEESKIKMETLPKFQRHKNRSLDRKSESSASSIKSGNRRLHRGRAVRRLLLIRQRREMSMGKLLRRSGKKFLGLLILLIIKLTLASILAFLIRVDFQKANFRVADVSKIRQSNFDVGAYPMSGMLLMACSSCLDGISVIIFGCGLACQCGYFRYYMRFAFVDFLMTFTGACTLFVSERKAVSYFKEFFKIILEFEYGDTEARMGTEFIDTIQQTGHCCGYSKPSDWTTSKWWALQEKRGKDEEFLNFPASCCDRTANNRVIGNRSACFEIGCETRIYAIAAQPRIICEYLAIGKSLVLLFCMVLCAAMYRDFIISSEREWEIGMGVSLTRGSSKRSTDFEYSHRRYSKWSRLGRDQSDISFIGNQSIDPNFGCGMVERQLFEIEESANENQQTGVTEEDTDVENGNGTGEIRPQ